MSRDSDSRPALAHLSGAYDAAIRGNLRFDCGSWILRDNGGWISRPASRSDFPDVAPTEEAESALLWEVWSRAVRAHNLTVLRAA